MSVPLTVVEHLIHQENGLAVVSVKGSAGGIASSVVNAGLLDHPVSGVRVAAFVIRGSSKKAAHLRADPFATIVWRVGWRWAGVSGPASLVGPDDLVDGVSADDVPAVLRAVFESAGGSHDDWDEFDRVMAAERRAAVFVVPERTFGTV
jgi:hypothetical protein